MTPAPIASLRARISRLQSQLDQVESDSASYGVEPPSDPGLSPSLPTRGRLEALLAGARTRLRDDEAAVIRAALRGTFPDDPEPTRNLFMEEPRP